MAVVLRQSSINTLLRCPRQYELEFVQNLKTPVFSYLYLGGTCHYAIAENYRYKMKNKLDMPLGQLLSTYSDAFDQMKYFEDTEPADVVWEEDKGYVKDTGILLMKEYHTKLAPKTDPLGVEVPFSRELGDGVVLQGRIDLLTPAMAVDHKTAKRKRSDQEMANDIQPTCYLIGLGSDLGGDFANHMLVKTKQPYVIDLYTRRSPEEIKWFREQVIPPIVKMIQGGIFPPNPTSFLCSPEYCRYYQACGRPRSF